MHLFHKQFRSPILGPGNQQYLRHTLRIRRPITTKDEHVRKEMFSDWDALGWGWGWTYFSGGLEKASLTFQMTQEEPMRQSTRKSILKKEKEQVPQPCNGNNPGLFKEQQAGQCGWSSGKVGYSPLHLKCLEVIKQLYPWNNWLRIQALGPERLSWNPAWSLPIDGLWDGHLPLWTWPPHL